MSLDCDECCGSGTRWESNISATGEYRGQDSYECPGCNGAGFLLKGDPRYEALERRRFQEVV